MFVNTVLPGCLVAAQSTRVFHPLINCSFVFGKSNYLGLESLKKDDPGGFWELGGYSDIFGSPCTLYNIVAL